MPPAIDSNSSQAYYGEETTLGVTSPGPFYPIEPNSYSNWGVTTKSVTRTPINISRQQSKGTTTALDVAAGFQSDYTQNNLLRLMQGFLFADIKEKATSAQMNAAKVAVDSVAVGSFTLHTAVAAFKAGQLALSSGLGQVLNNGLLLISAIAGAVISATRTDGVANVVEAAPPVLAKMVAVGFRLTAAAAMTLVGAVVAITDSGVDFTTMGLTPGEWVYVGDKGNATAALDFNFYGATSGLVLRGFARISAIAAHTLSFDFVTFGSTGDSAGALKGGAAGANLYFGSFLANQTTLTTIKRRSYTMPRYLGKGVGNADQLEIMRGCVADKFTLNIAQASKVDADLTFVGMGSDYTNDTALIATPQPFFNETCYNTSRDLYASLLTVNGTDSTSLFAYATDVKMTIDNQAKVAAALGSVSGFDVTVGDFKVGGTATLYFDDINSIAAVQNNADVGMTNIFAARNAGTVFDIPLVTLGGGQLKIVKDTKIMADLTTDAAANKYGYSMSLTNFSYLPDSAVSGYAGL
jgi:hypothetical protein